LVDRQGRMGLVSRWNVASTRLPLKWAVSYSVGVKTI